MMTQEEVNKLLSIHETENIKKPLINEDEADTLGEIGNICMGTCATTLFALLGKRTNITTPKVSVGTLSNHLQEYNKPYIVAEVSYTEGISGYNMFLLKKEDVLVITDILLGGDGKPNPDGEIDELALSAISEVMNQMIGSSSTSLANLLGSSINISTPTVKEIEIDSVEPFDLLCKDEVNIKISFTMEIEDILVSEIMQIIPLDCGKELVKRLQNEEEEPTTVLQPEMQDIVIPPSSNVVNPAISAKQQSDRANSNIVQNVAEVKSIQYQTFDETPKIFNEEVDNLDLLMEIPLEITVELGSCKKSIKEILNLNIGSVVVLDRLAGEMVDVMVNGVKFAIGEVVVIDDNYGVRLTEIIRPPSQVIGS